MEELNDYLQKIENKNIIVKQEGFVKCKYAIKKMKYLIENDILTITAEENNNNLQININQIYEVNTETNKIALKLDNDLTITLNV